MADFIILTFCSVFFSIFPWKEFSNAVLSVCFWDKKKKKNQYLKAVFCFWDKKTIQHLELFASEPIFISFDVSEFAVTRIASKMYQVVLSLALFGSYLFLLHAMSETWKVYSMIIQCSLQMTAISSSLGKYYNLPVLHHCDSTLP